MMNLRRSRALGTVLLAVLVVSVFSGMVALSLMYRLRAEHTAAAAGRGLSQARSAALSGLHHATHVVMRSPLDVETWQDNPTEFFEHLVADDGADRWYFTVYTRDTESVGSEQDMRYGLIDESSRVNVSALKTMLLEGKQMAVEGGEEQLPPDAALADDHDSADQLTSAWSTTWSYTWNIDQTGKPQVNLNTDVERLAELKLSDATLKFIAKRRSQATEATSEHPVGGPFVHPADLLEARATIVGDDGKQVEIESGIGREDLSELLERTTTEPKLRHVSRQVNVNTASAQVLALVPGVDAALATNIVARRADLRADDRRTIAWVLEEGLVDVDSFKSLAPWITTRGFQYRMSVVGYGVPSGRYCVLEAVVDVGYPQPRVVYLHDVTRQGIPFPLTDSKESADE